MLFSFTERPRGSWLLLAGPSWLVHVDGHAPWIARKHHLGLHGHRRAEGVLRTKSTSLPVVTEALEDSRRT